MGGQVVPDPSRQSHVEARGAGRGDRLVAQDSHQRRRSSRSSIWSSTMATTRRATCEHHRRLRGAAVDLFRIDRRLDRRALRQPRRCRRRGTTSRPCGQTSRHRQRRWRRRGVKRARVAERRTSAASAPALPTVGSALDVQRSSDTCGRFLPVPRVSSPIPLDAPVLAHSQGAGFADVRVVDDAGRQVPYLVERASEPLSLDLTIEPVATRPVVAAVGSHDQRLSRAPAARGAAVTAPGADHLGARVHAAGHGRRRARPGSAPARSVVRDARDVGLVARRSGVAGAGAHDGAASARGRDAAGHC